LVDKDPGLVGNLLVERLVGAHIDLVSKEEYGKIGSVVGFFSFLVIYLFVGI
jgi:D-cysteine desulfhydrase